MKGNMCSEGTQSTAITPIYDYNSLDFHSTSLSTRY